MRIMAPINTDLVKRHILVARLLLQSDNSKPMVKVTSFKNVKQEIKAGIVLGLLRPAISNTQCSITKIGEEINKEYLHYC